MRAFAAAVKDDPGRYTGADAPVPPTWPFVMSYWGSMGTGGAAGLPIEKLRGPGRMILHGEQEFQYHRPPRVGETLTGTGRISDVYEKDTSKATMEFYVREIDWRERAASRWSPTASRSSSGPEGRLTVAGALGTDPFAETEDQAALRQLARDVAERELAPVPPMATRPRSSREAIEGAGRPPTCSASPSASSGAGSASATSRPRSCSRSSPAPTCRARSSPSSSSTDRPAPSSTSATTR